GDSAKLSYVAAVEPMWVTFSVSQNQLAKLREMARPGARQPEEGFVADAGLSERDHARAGSEAVRRPGVHVPAISGGRARPRAAARDPTAESSVPRAQGRRRAEAAHQRRLEPAGPRLVTRRSGDCVPTGLDRHERGARPGPAATLRAHGGGRRSAPARNAVRRKRRTRDRKSVV